MDKRLVDIKRLVAAYSAGDFTQRVTLSDELDEMDDVKGAFNMLGEELAMLTVSRDYFNDIFNAMTEMALVITLRGEIEELNQAVCGRLGYTKDMLIGRRVDMLVAGGGVAFSRLIRKEPGPDGLVRIWERAFLTFEGEAVPVVIVARPLPGKGARGRGCILVTAKDVGPQLAAENKLLRAVIDAQEQERQRLARDLHDGLGQQLSAVKFLVSAAVRELGEQLEQARVMRVSLVVGRDLPELPRALQIDLYRVVQEFVANAVRHGEATWLRAKFSLGDGSLWLRLRDNGRGFDAVSVQGSGMGLRNMHSRIRSHQGVFELKSWPGRGTEVRIKVAVVQA